MFVRDIKSEREERCCLPFMTISTIILSSLSQKSPCLHSLLMILTLSAGRSMASISSSGLEVEACGYYHESYPQLSGPDATLKCLISRQLPYAEPRELRRQSVLSNEVELPPQVQEQLVRLQQLQQTLQSVATQKQQLELELNETDKAITELDRSTDETPVYKSVGSILVKSNRQTLLGELKERKELLTTRVTVLGKQEERTKERLKEVQEKLQERLQGPRTSQQQ